MVVPHNNNKTLRLIEADLR